MRVFKYKKKLYGFLLVFLYESSSFSANETTKQLINKTLAKYGISAGGKEICGTGREPDYNKDTGVVKCKNDSVGDDNNCWDANSRLCKECPNGTIVSKQDHITCRQIVCPEGYELIEVKEEKDCPEGFELQKDINSCDENFNSYSEIQATKNYTSTSTNCNNIN